MTDAYAKTLVLDSNKKLASSATNDALNKEQINFQAAEELPIDDEAFTQSYSYLT